MYESLPISRLGSRLAGTSAERSRTATVSTRSQPTASADRLCKPSVRLRADHYPARRGNARTVRGSGPPWRCSPEQIGARREVGHRWRGPGQVSLLVADPAPPPAAVICEGRVSSRWVTIFGASPTLPSGIASIGASCDHMRAWNAGSCRLSCATCSGARQHRRSRYPYDFGSQRDKQVGASGAALRGRRFVWLARLRTTRAATCADAEPQMP